MFERAYVEITNVCNLNCSFCPGTKRQKKFISLEEFDTVCKKLKPYTDYLYLHVMGEPLLHPNLSEILSISNDYGFNVNITTNGTLIKEKESVLLNAKNLKKVFVSLHSFEGNDGDNIIPYLNNVWEFYKKAHCIVSLRLWNEGGKDGKNGEIIEYLMQKTGVDIYKLFSEKDSITLEKFRYLEKAEKFEWPSLSAKRTGVKFCHGLTQQIAVLCDGTVVPCCLDSEGTVNLGNILGQDLKDVLEGERAKKFIQGFMRKCPSEDLCVRCGYATRFD